MGSHWLFSYKNDLLYLFLPVWATWLIAFLLPGEYIQTEIAPWVLIIFVFGIDVGHVWSTLFRTYLDSEEFSNHRRLLIRAPVIAFVASCAIAFVSIDLFWRGLAYVAVFHFVKQQYGFMRLYKAKSGDFRKKHISDNFVIYASMLFPVLYWHLSPGRNFEWFVEGDFIQYNLAPEFIFYFTFCGNILYFTMMGGWVIEEIYYRAMNGSPLPVGKIIWILTTAGNWYIGIVFFNSDFVFTITNIVAHGLPYFALIVFYTSRKKMILENGKPVKKVFGIAYTIVLVVFLLAFLEEFFWDQFVYQEEEGIFQSAFGIPFPEIENYVKILAMALLSVPQITHYIIDGFIWKNNDKNPYVKPILLGE